jgi:hypothetical protein
LLVRIAIEVIELLHTDAEAGVGKGPFPGHLLSPCLDPKKLARSI